jgi:hypothetical protein
MSEKLISVEIGYLTSIGKWKGIRTFAETNNIPTEKINAMINRIEKQGDASIDKLVTFTISNYKDLLCAIYNDFELHPRPHCCKYSCEDCPLDDETHGCCKEWSEVKKQFKSLVQP